MWRLALALGLAIPALVAGASAVRAADANCTGSLDGNITGNVVVPNGGACTLTNATVAGNVQVLQNAALTVDATAQPTTIGGSVQAVGCVSAILEGGVTVTGSVEIVRCSQQSGFIGPGVKIGGAFQCSNDAGAARPTSARSKAACRSRAAAPPTSALSQSVGPAVQRQHRAADTRFGADFVTGSLQGQCAASLGFAPPTTAPSCIASTLNVPNVSIISGGMVQPQPPVWAAGRVSTSRNSPR